ncbi:MAG: glycosyltransferase family 52 protein [Bacteroidales bacterium]|jgi:hypothetical protein|nr:glycosyltransferase family 52 protein [Bacteroidales bacterium]
MKHTYTRVCIAGTVYPLLLYLLYSSEEEIHNTYFFFGRGVPHSIRQKFPNYYFFDEEQNKFKRKLMQNAIFMILFVRFGQIIRWPFLRQVKIFGQDHLFYSCYLIGNKKYTLIEDAPHIMHLTEQKKHLFDYWKTDKFFKKRLLYKIIGGTFLHHIGDNNICEEVILTVDETAPHLKGKKRTVISTFSLWDNSTESKKDLILRIYDIEKEDIAIMKSKENVLFTQQFSSDGVITVEEQEHIYRQIIDNYNHNSILIKTHPRDFFDYKKAFPHIVVFNKIVPVQLFDLLGVKFKKAITVSSSAVTSFNYDLEIDWYGTEISDSLLKAVGHCAMKVL